MHLLTYSKPTTYLRLCENNTTNHIALKHTRTNIHQWFPCMPMSTQRNKQKPHSTERLQSVLHRDYFQYKEHIPFNSADHPVDSTHTHTYGIYSIHSRLRHKRTIFNLSSTVHSNGSRKPQMAVHHNQDPLSVTSPSTTRNSSLQTIKRPVTTRTTTTGATRRPTRIQQTQKQHYNTKNGNILALTPSQDNRSHSP